jgi:hypothetical protein
MFNNLLGLLWNTSSSTDGNENINEDIQNIDNVEIKSSTISLTNKKNTSERTGIHISPTAQSIASTPRNAISSSSSSANSDNRSVYEKAKSMLSANASGGFLQLRLALT